VFTQIQLTGPVGPVLKNLLPTHILIPRDTQIAKDEVHLIMEYGLHEKWGNLQSPAANRFITSYDQSNSELIMLDKFFAELKPFSPELVILSGLHLLETQPLSMVTEKMDQVRDGLRNVPVSIPVHLELASMANEKNVKLIVEQVGYMYRVRTDLEQSWKIGLFWRNHGKLWKIIRELSWNFSK